MAQNCQHRKHRKIANTANYVSATHITKYLYHHLKSILIVNIIALLCNFSLLSAFCTSSLSPLFKLRPISKLCFALPLLHFLHSSSAVCTSCFASPLLCCQNSSHFCIQSRYLYSSVLLCHKTTNTSKHCQQLKHALQSPDHKQFSHFQEIYAMDIASLEESFI